MLEANPLKLGIHQPENSPIMAHQAPKPESSSSLGEEIFVIG